MTDLSIIIPVHKESRTVVEELYHKLKALGAEVIIVDDGSSMDLTIPHMTYYPHMGYGYAIKVGLKGATRHIAMTIDGDGQHTIKDVSQLYAVYKMLDCKMIVGQRWNLEEKPLRWLGRKVLNFIASCIAGHYLVDLNSGMRIFDRQMAIGYSPILCDTFSFTTSMTMAVVTDKHKISYIPINVQPRQFGKSHVKVVKDGFITLYYIVWIGVALRTRGLRKWLRSLFGR